MRTLRKVLVTGGAGFIGSNVARMTGEETSAEITILDNLSSGYRENVENLRAVFVPGDVRDAVVVRQVMEGVDTVFHLAASVGNTRSIDDPVQDAEVNVLGTIRVLEAARQAGVRKLVFSSSAGIFGELKTLPIREDHPVEPDTPYGASKLCAEKLCLSYAKLYPIECICLRYFNVYGVNQRYDAYGNVIPIFVHRVLHGEPISIFGDGEQTRDFVNVQDVARANLRAAQADGVSGAFNIASGTSITITRLAERVLETSGRHTPVTYAPPRRGDVRHSRADIGAAAAAFGYAPAVPLEAGLQEYWRWASETLVPAR